MISWQSVWAVTLRLSRLLMRDTNLMLSLFYWPILDVLIWGFLGSWIQTMQGSSSNYEMIALLGILLWAMVGRTANVTIESFGEELWARNLVNLFSSPLSLFEWMLGMTVYNSIVMSMTALCCVGLIFLLYTIPIWYFLSIFFIFLPPLFLSGLCLGFISLGVIVCLGKRAQQLGHVIAWFFMPFSGAFYPLEILPSWAQIISYCLPMSYLFEGVRQYVLHQQSPVPYLMKGCTMVIVYMAIAIVLFVFFFDKSKHKGLARLSD